MWILVNNNNSTVEYIKYFEQKKCVNSGKGSFCHAVYIIAHLVGMFIPIDLFYCFQTILKRMCL